MNKKATVRLRVYRGKKMSFNEHGQAQNENHTVTLVHDTLEWSNFMKYLRPNGYCKVEVEDVQDGDKEAIAAEVTQAYELPKAALTPEQQRIADLEAKLEALTKGESKEASKKPAIK